jgi:hypothetical protein
MGIDLTPSAASSTSEATYKSCEVEGWIDIHFYRKIGFSIGELLRQAEDDSGSGYPNDARRLVMPPSVSIPLAIMFWVLFAITFGRLAPPISAGFGFGYVCYDSIHYAIHHFAMKRGVCFG